MPRDITVTFDDGSTHVYKNAPDDVTPDAITARASRDFAGRAITHLDGGRKPKADAAPAAEKRDIFSPFVDTVRGAAHQVAEDVREDAALLKQKPSDQRDAVSAGRDILKRYAHPFDAGGFLRFPKEVADVAAAVSSPVAGAINIVSDPIEQATRFGGKKGVDLSDALMVLGPEVGGANKLAAMSKAARAAKGAEAATDGAEAAAGVKPRVRVKAGSAPSPDAAIDEAQAKGEKPSKNTIKSAQAEWAKSSGDPKHAVRVGKLLEDGVELTVGQRAGGMARRMEEANKSNPYIGGAIREQEQKALTSFNAAVFRKSLKAAGLPDAMAGEGRDFVKTGQQRFSEAYEKDAEHYRVEGDDTLIKDLMDTHNATVELPSDKRRQFEATMQRRVLGRMGIEPEEGETFMNTLQRLKGKRLDGKLFKQVESEMTQIAGKFHSSPDPADHMLADHFDEALSALRDNMERSSDPEVRERLRKLNTGYAMFTRGRAAAANRATSGGKFTTGDFLQAVKRQDKSAAKGSFARGDALFQDFAEDAHAVLSNVLPDSGTAERLNVTRPGPLGGVLGGALGSVAGPAGAVAGGLAGFAADTGIQGVTNNLAAKAMANRTRRYIRGEKAVAPGTMNYLKRAQGGAGQYGSVVPVAAALNQGQPQ